MAWRLAPSLVAMGEELNRRWPNRNKASDGTIGDASHSSRTSDHNPDEKGMVHARDVTHDPNGGPDCAKLVAIVASNRDQRLRYQIFNRRIMYGPESDGVKAGHLRPWVWFRYDGSNPHTAHAHFSVGYNKADENNTAPWFGQGDWLEMATEAEVKRLLDGLRQQVREDVVDILRAAFGGFNPGDPKDETVRNSQSILHARAFRAATAAETAVEGFAETREAVSKLAQKVEALKVGGAQVDVDALADAVVTEGGRRLIRDQENSS